MTLDDVKNYYREVFGLTQGAIAVVGDFEPEALVEALGANLVEKKRATVPFERIISDLSPLKRLALRSIRPTRKTRCSLRAST